MPLPASILAGFAILVALGAVGWRADPPPPRPGAAHVAESACSPTPPFLGVPALNAPELTSPGPPSATGKPYPAPARPGPLTHLEPRTLHFWAVDPNPGSYQIGQATLIVSTDGDTPQDLDGTIGLRFTVQAPGTEPGIICWSEIPPRAWFGAGRLDPQRPEPQVLLMTSLGGTHCCETLFLISPHEGRWRFEPLITLDGAGWIWPEDGKGQLTWPKDTDGDGFPEILVVDNNFIGAFTGYVGSLPPPIVYQIEDGQLVDVSNRPAFRKLFEKELPELTRRCREENFNSACASMVAVASRLGQRGQAWKIMLESYSREDEVYLPTWCRVDPGNADCPADQLETYPDFPTALAAFLKHYGYGSAGTR